MNTRLISVAIVGLVSSGVLLTSGVVLSGRDLASQGYQWGKWRPACQAATSNDKQLALPYAGADSVTIDLPALVSYRPGNGPQAIISGEQALVDQVRIEDGKISLDCDPGSQTVKLNVQLTGPAISDWTLLGRGDLSLMQLNQPQLRLRIRGSGSVIATGATEKLDLDLSGSGAARLNDFIAQSAQINIRGSGNAQIAAQKDAEVSIFGSGNVELSGAPALRRSELRGSGRIVSVP
ncbi:DUF2807 domain-containing protein [Rhizobium leguminosarum]|uniref:GIN domain-containing protein n=1 Tax=Rhizobium leguminosarum TaxID=384 RepID=UPI003F9E322D